MSTKHVRRFSHAFSGFVSGLVFGALAANQYYQFIRLNGDCNYDGLNYRNNWGGVGLASLRVLRKPFSSSLSFDDSVSATFSGAEAQEIPSLSGGSSYTERRIPKDSKSRFLKYARRDEVSGEYVQYLDDFIACIFLMDPLPRNHAGLTHSKHYETSSNEKHNGTKTASHSVASFQQFPPSVRTRMKSFFTAVDLDYNGKINYAEFVMLFTMLSIRRSTLHRAFRLFDLDDNGRLNASELVLLLNTVMVDPAVQIRDVGRGKDEQETEEIHIISKAPLMKIGEKGTDSQGNGVKQSNQQVDSSDRRASIFSSWFSIMDIFLIKENQTGEYLPVRSSKSSRNTDLSFDLLFSSVERVVFGPILRDGLALPGSVHQRSTSKQMNHVKNLECGKLIDADKKLITFDTFWYRANFLRSELRAIEFGIFDPENTGFIHCDDFQKILTHQVDCRPTMPEKKTATEMGKGPRSSRASSCSGVGGGFRPNVSWRLYQTIFEIIRESDVVSHALQLTLDAEPPALPSQLVAGAIPESQRKQILDQIGELTRELYTANAEHAKATLKKLVRPTGLMPPQLNQALRSCDDIPRLTLEESELFCYLFDVDRSGSISPAEFSRLCEAKQTFFAPYIPRFTESRKNKIQEFLHCMQQLD